MTTTCLTVDVEDFYEGMHTLGYDLEPPRHMESGLSALSRLLEATQSHITLFVVGRYAAKYATELRELADAGHEIASHGPDHGRLPEARPQIGQWLQTGREQVEEVLQRPVLGFRSPRFDVPAQLTVAQFREEIAGAGFTYVSDTHESGPGAALAELPVTQAGRLPLGGGSYQRLLPSSVTTTWLRRRSTPAVLYYHSYDFGHELPALREARAPAVVAQLLVRSRIRRVFQRVLTTFGSRTCSEVVDAVR